MKARYVLAPEAALDLVLIWRCHREHCLLNGHRLNRILETSSQQRSASAKGLTSSKICNLFVPIVYDPIYPRDCRLLHAELQSRECSRMAY